MILELIQSVFLQMENKLSLDLETKPLKFGIHKLVNYHELYKDMIVVLLQSVFLQMENKLSLDLMTIQLKFGIKKIYINLL